jgi:drug/metabolite transporter (DMT)-like permease
MPRSDRYIRSERRIHASAQTMHPQSVIGKAPRTDESGPYRIDEAWRNASQLQFICEACVIGVAVALALITAVMHATWNVLLKSSGDPLRTAARAVRSAVMILGPVGALVWLLAGRPGMPGIAWLMVILSACAELAYFVCLSEAYRRGELSLVYPLARGSAPLLAVAAGIAILGERPGVIELVGILLLLAGIWAIQKPTSAGSATIPALLTGLAIATYSAIDKVGTGNRPLMYGWILAILTTVLLTGWVWLAERGEVSRVLRLHRPPQGEDPQAGTDWRRSILMGLFMTSSYLLVLVALSLAPLVVVAPARESAIVLVTVWGIWKLRERERAWQRLGGAAGIVTGLVLLVVR